MRLANPEIHIAQHRPLEVAQNKRFVVVQSGSFKIDPAKVIVDELSRSVTAGPAICELCSYLLGHTRAPSGILVSRLMMRRPSRNKSTSDSPRAKQVRFA
jgi:hypothetical protein